MDFDFPLCFKLFLILIHFVTPSEKAVAPHSSTLARKIPWTEEPGGLQSMGSRRVGHDGATSLSLFTSCIGEGNGNPFQCFCLENPRDGGAWWASVYGVTQSRTRLKRLSSSSSSLFPIFACYLSVPHYSSSIFFSSLGSISLSNMHVLPEPA